MFLIWYLLRTNSESRITRIKGFHGLRTAMALRVQSHDGRYPLP